MVEKNGLTAYITYPATPQIRSVLLREVRHTRYKVFVNGKPTTEKHIKIPTKIIDSMKTRKEITLSINTVPVFTGITNVFGVIGTSTNILNDVGNVRIRVTGENFEKLMINISTIKSEMYKYFKETPKMCVWRRENALDAQEEKEKKTVEFNNDELKRRREMELKTSRQR
jgi:hypothetical protein